MAFNIKLSAALLGVLALTGCQTSGLSEKKKKEATTLQLHLEVNSDGTPYNYPVQIFRAAPVAINIHKEWFLNEGDVTEAAVVPTPGGFAIMIQFNKHGTLLLDTATARYRGQRIAIHSLFGESRWLAAPRIERHLTDGILVFTPDATREEAERIVLGLNNVAKELSKRTWK